MTPAAISVQSLMRWHHENAETVSADVLAREARMTLTELCECLEEVRQSLIEDLWPTGLRAA